ncbi:MAG: terminase, partial [Planctomycetota bacterium]
MNKPSRKEPARVRPVVPLLPYQREDLESDARFRWNCWARQTGKSFTKSLRRILRGLIRRRTQILLSAGERQSRELMEKVRRHCAALKIATDRREGGFFRDMRFKQLEVTLPRGVRIVALPANPETARGYTGDVFLDEFAMHAHDREIWAAVFPSVLRGGGELDIASTPKGNANLFARLKDNPLFETSSVTLPEAIAQGLDADAEAMRRAMGDDALYRQEFLCDFLDGATALLSHEQVRTCGDPSLPLYASAEELARERRPMFVGVDVGRMRDLTVVWVLAREDDALSTVAWFELASAPFREQFELLK